jgi:hypothetical protein
MRSLRYVVLASAFVLLSSTIALADPPPWAGGPPPWAGGPPSRSVPLPGTELLFGVGFVALAWTYSWRKGKSQES